MNAGRILCSILLGMYAIYIIRNNTITIAGSNTKRSILLTMIQLGQLLMIELMVVFWGGGILHSFSIFSLILAVLLWGEIFALKQNLNKYFMCKEGRSYGISIIGKGRIAVSVGQSILLILPGIWSW
ncbi:hypothetical protein [uncultured Veillonella sp.]|uniref:hypothetical protein n=1 Tax=uncultured Veillonella sp. TaxID=159268 RepID=UPI002804C392|nr:hypothetical protein [uncultured Veillonella sp.]